MGLASYILPFIDEYDTRSEAERLMELPVISARHDIATVQAALEVSKEKYRRLVTAAKVADTTDRFTSLTGAIVETIGTIAGAGPGFMANGLEEGIELMFKAPMIYLLNKDPSTKGHITGLLLREAGTAMVPVAGDLYDMATNRFLKTAYEVIRDDAKMELLKDH